MKNMVKIIVLLIALAINGVVFGAHVNQTTAQTMATTVATKGENHLKSASVLSLVYAKENAFYVFGNETSFVIVAADDRVTPILGYSNEGPFIVPSTNDSTGNNFLSLLNSYQKQIEYVVDNNIAATSTIAAQWENLKSGNVLKSASVVVTPLLTTTWDQRWPYNALCPIDTKGPGGHVAIGCVGVAMAQILKYHNYPNQGLGSYGYQSGTYPTTTADFGATTYNWVNMPNSISTPNNDVAALLYQTAVSVRSTWGFAGTSAPSTNVIISAVNYFRCAFSSIRYVKRSEYSTIQWDDLLQTELVNKRPIYYAGYGSSGHAWVCDGVDSSNLYHFNWGWGGSYNGYFPLTAIAPGTSNYTDRQEAIIGIQPNDGSTLLSNTSWSGSVNNLTSIAVPDAVTLTVNAGAVIKFAKDTKLQVFGKILSTGVNSNYTLFTAMDTTTGWWGIKFENDYMNGEVMIDNDTSRFVYTQIQYSDMSGINIKGFNKVVIDHCTINNNYITGSGAGISASGSVKVVNSKIYKNTASLWGGGLYIISNDDFMTTIYNNEIFRNSAGNGGGIRLLNSALLSDNIIHNNQADFGAGVYLTGNSIVSQISVISNVFCNNIATKFGGGLYIAGCSPKIINNLIANNLTSSFTKGNGGGISFSQNASPQIFNNTIVNNRSYQGGALGVDLNYDGQVSLKNCIIYGNTSVNTGSQIMLGMLSNFSPLFDHCVVQGGINAFGGSGASSYVATNYTNTIDTNPLFVSPSIGAGSGYDGMVANWQLLPTSPCINVGDITGITTLLPPTDLAGNPRINGFVDMGAYEFVCTLPQTPNQPIGPDTVHSKTTPTSIYTTTAVSTADYYVWEIIPSNAGSLSGTTTSVIVTWNTTYVGNVQIRVKATNACGSSQYSSSKNIYVDLSTAINEVELQSNIKVYPNPCDGMFTISSHKEISSLFMYDVSGRTVLFPAPILGTTVAVDCSTLPKGLYVIHAYLRDTQQRMVQKVVIK